MEEVRIEALKDNILYAIVQLRHGKVTKEVEARASDALALAAQTNCAITVEDSILNSMGMDLAEGQTKLAQEDLDRILHFMREKQPQGPLTRITNRGGLTIYPDQPRNLDGSEGTSGWAMTGSHVQNYDYLFDR